MRGEWNRLMTKLNLDIGQSLSIDDPGLSLPQHYDVDPRLADIVFHQGFAEKEIMQRMDHHYLKWTVQRPAQVDTVLTQTMMETCIESARGLTFLPCQELIDLHSFLKRRAVFNSDHWTWVVQDPHMMVEPDLLPLLDKLIGYRSIVQVPGQDRLWQMNYYVDIQIGEPPQPSVSASPKNTVKKRKVGTAGKGATKVPTIKLSENAFSVHSLLIGEVTNEFLHDPRVSLLAYGLNAAEINVGMAELEKKGIISIEDKGKQIYRLNRLDVIEDKQHDHRPPNQSNPNPPPPPTGSSVSVRVPTVEMTPPEQRDFLSLLGLVVWENRQYLPYLPMKARPATTMNDSARISKFRKKLRIIDRDEGTHGYRLLAVKIVHLEGQGGNSRVAEIEAIYASHGFVLEPCTFEDFFQLDNADEKGKPNANKTGVTDAPAPPSEAPLALVPLAHADLLSVPSSDHAELHQAFLAALTAPGADLENISRTMQFLAGIATACRDFPEQAIAFVAQLTRK